MRRAIATACVVLVAIAAATAHASIVRGGAVVPDERLSSRSALSSWTLAPAPGGPAIPAYKVQVPCTVIACLLAAGHYDFDPFYGKNLQRIPFEHFETPWTYTTTFALAAADATALQAGGRALLHLEGINYRAELEVNGQIIAKRDTLFGALNRFDIDITSAVNTSSGALQEVKVTLWRMYNDYGQWRNNGTDLGLWFDDWNPHPPDLNLGLYRPVSFSVVAAIAPFTFDGFVADTKVEFSGEHETAIAYVNFSVAVTLWNEAAIPEGSSLQLPVSLVTGLPGAAGPFATTLEFRRVPKDPSSAPWESGLTLRASWSWVEHAPLTLVDAPLWWPWQFGDSRPFFTATVSAGAASKPFSYALRDVRRRLTTDGALQLVVNRRPVAIMAGGFPPDMFQRVDSGRLANDFQMMRAMGLNAVRLEGMFMEDEFYDVADRSGFLVMPGFGCCDGWQHWPQWPRENYRVAAESARQQARRLGQHPSVIAFLMSSDQLPPPEIEEMYLRVFSAEAWPNAIVSSASQQFSYVSGISGVKMVGPYSWVPPNYWLDDGKGQLANGTTMNYGGAWGFLTEGGPGEAPMTYSSWVRTVPQEHLWNATTGSMDSWWSWHMGCPFGHFRNLTFYTPPLDGRYGVSTNAQTYLYRAQAANYEGIRAMFESYSRNRHINATGIVQWQVKMAWPSHLWNLYDYYFVGGGGFYAASRALERLHAMMSYNDGSVWLVGNRYDTPTLDAINVTAAVYLLNGQKLWARSIAVLGGLPADGTVDLPELQIPGPAQVKAMAKASKPITYLVRLQWHVGTAAPQTNWYWLSTQPDLIGPWDGSNSFRTPCYQWADFSQLNALPAVELRTAQRGLNVSVTNAGTAVAFLVQVRFVDAGASDPTVAPDLAPIVCDDNFFSVLPGDTVNVTCSTFGATFPNAKAVVSSYNSVVANAASTGSQ